MDNHKQGKIPQSQSLALHTQPSLSGLMEYHYHYGIYMAHFMLEKKAKSHFRPSAARCPGGRGGRCRRRKVPFSAVSLLRGTAREAQRSVARFGATEAKAVRQADERRQIRLELKLRFGVDCNCSGAFNV